MNIFNNIKTDWVYWVFSLLLGGFLVGLVFYNLGVLVENFNVAMNGDLIKSEPVVKFNLEKIKELGI